MKVDLNIISDKDFDMWYRDPTTKAVFKEIHNYRRTVNEAMTDARIVLYDHNELIRLAGMRDGLDVLLQIEAVDFDEDKVDEND